MRGRVVLGLALALLSVPGGVAAGDPGSDGRTKEQIDARIARLRDEIAGARGREGVLTSQLSDVTSALRDAQARVDGQQTRVVALEASLGAARTRVAHAGQALREKTAFLQFTEQLDGKARRRLEQRIRLIYMQGRPDLLSVLLSARSFSQALDDVEFVNRVARQDRRIVGEAERAHAAAERARADAVRAKAVAVSRQAEVARRTAEATAARDRLVASRDAVASVQRVKAQALDSAREDRRSYLEEATALEAQSAALAERIRTAQATSGYEPPSGGSPGRLQWPVSGSVTSGFGMRWGRMHEGIDIAVPAGTPVHAAAAGRIAYAGWMSGYGNLVVVDHGGGLSTAYGHNTSVTVSVGQDVAAGEEIAVSGSTGHSTGPHVHFEVRVNGAPVDPLGYL
jgi:murein DD-endopeptidase MepM/ murein hydrolase activator NlpD